MMKHEIMIEVMKEVKPQELHASKDPHVNALFSSNFSITVKSFSCTSSNTLLLNTPFLSPTQEQRMIHKVLTHLFEDLNHITGAGDCKKHSESFIKRQFLERNVLYIEKSNFTKFALLIRGL